jgi:hypothetical protein
MPEMLKGYMRWCASEDSSDEVDSSSAELWTITVVDMFRMLYACCFCCSETDKGITRVREKGCLARSEGEWCGASTDYERPNPMRTMETLCRSHRSGPRDVPHCSCEMPSVRHPVICQDIV